jgi:arsenical pump membrane protein
VSARRLLTVLAGADPLNLIAAVLAVLAALAVLTGILPGHEANATIRRILPLLGFLIAAVVLAELVREAEVFDVAASWLARTAGGRPAVLFGLCVLLATLTTVTLNLDTTAVLLTPVLLALAVRIGLAPLTTAMTTVWLANTASLLLPISNLTNVLAADRLGLPPLGFAARMALPAVVAVAVTALLLWLCFWRPAIRYLPAGRYPVPEVHVPGDGRLAVISLTGALLFLAAVLTGLPLWVAAGAGAAVAVAGFAVRRRSSLRPGLLPWRLVVLLIGVFLVIQAVSGHGLGALVDDMIGASSGGASGGTASGGDAVVTIRAAATGTVLANLVNNLPAYVAGEGALTSAGLAGAGHQALFGLLIGVNLGPLITPWASLATVLWFERCRAVGVRVPVRRFVATGALLVVTTVTGATAVLLLSRA